LALHELNIILLEKKLPFFEFSTGGEIAEHIVKVLRLEVGSEMDVGVPNGPKGKAKLLEKSEYSLKISVNWNEDHPSDHFPVNLIVGLSRPQTCRKILDQATSMGVKEMHFFAAEKSESSYRKSRLWQTREWQDKIKKGAEQSFSTHIPSCKVWEELSACLTGQPEQSCRIAMDNYESKKNICSMIWNKFDHFTLAIGPERGWSKAERDQLRNQGFTLLSMGSRVLRQETAVVASLSQVIGQFWSP
jgi:RsmE family RNA methyltransferase